MGGAGRGPREWFVWKVAPQFLYYIFIFNEFSFVIFFCNFLLKFFLKSSFPNFRVVSPDIFGEFSQITQFTCVNLLDCKMADQNTEPRVDMPCKNEAKSVTKANVTADLKTTQSTAIDGSSRFSTDGEPSLAQVMDHLIQNDIKTRAMISSGFENLKSEVMHEFTLLYNEINLLKQRVEDQEKIIQANVLSIASLQAVNEQNKKKRD